MRGATVRSARTTLTKLISIHAPRAGSDCNIDRPPLWHMEISIHAPRAGSDEAYFSEILEVLEISIHAPRAGSDICEAIHHVKNLIFQSTLPVRGATLALISLLWS